MALETQAEPDDLTKLLAALSGAPFNGKAGNKSLREVLGWADTPERYWQAHERAVDSGRIATGKGKGGSVRLQTLSDDTTEDEGEEVVVAEPIAANTAPAEVPAPKEVDLYDGARESIESGWAKPYHFDNLEVAITAARGSAKTGGKWTRPDITLLGIKAYRYLPDRVFEIVTFEIKPANQITVEGVFEALSHSQFATKSFVVYHVPDQDEDARFPENHQRILDTARQHGIGVITANDMSNYDTWGELVAPVRSPSDPEQTNRFLTTCFTEAVQEKVIKWHK